MKKRPLTESEKMIKLNRFLNESELSPEQEKEMDLDDDGDIDADDLANLRSGKKDDDIVGEADHEEPDGDEDEFGNEPEDHNELDEAAIRPNAKKGDHKQGIQLLDKLNASGIDLNDAIAKLDAWVYKSDPKVMPKENVKLVKELRNEWFKLQRTIRSTISNMNLQFQGDTDEKSGFRNESTQRLKDMIKEMVKEVMDEK